jgi:hypothetical protein
VKSSSGKPNIRPKVVVTAGYADLREAAAEIHQLRLSARRELDLARQAREEAVRYQQATGTRARSEAQQLILKARLATQQQIEVLRQASEEIQKALDDIRVIRIAAQEELAAQRRFADAAHLCSMSSAYNDAPAEADDTDEQPTPEN